MCNGRRSNHLVTDWCRFTLSFLTGWLVLAFSAEFGLSRLHAQNHPTSIVETTPTDGQAASPSANKRHARSYFIEFRARNAQSYGHTFALYGRLDAQGKIISREVAGLHPMSESPIPWMIGHLVLVPSETGASDGDTEDQYVMARFRVAMNEGEYRKVTSFIKQLKDKSPVWHAVLYNCNAFVADIAQFMGLKVPQSTLLKPANYIDTLRDLNIGRSNLAGVIGSPAKVEDPATLRAAALRALAKREALVAKREARSQQR